MNDRIVNIFNSYNIQNLDARKAAMNVENVLTQRHGSQWIEAPAAGNNNTPMVATTDWIKYVLDLPMEAQPGTKFNYSTGHSILTAGMVQMKTPYRANDFAKAFLFDPIGIRSAGWWCTDPRTGIGHTGGCLEMTSQDMARFGFLMLNNGKWNGQQIVSKTYLDLAFNPQSFNVSLNGSHGYQMWLTPATVNGRTYQMRTTAGAGGQYIFVVPELDLVVVTTGSNYDAACSACITAPITMMRQDIIPAALGM